MFRFDRLIHGGMTVREVRQRHPATAEVFEALGFRASCDDCDIETIARKSGLDGREVLNALNRAAFGGETDTDDHASIQS